MLIFKYIYSPIHIKTNGITDYLMKSIVFKFIFEFVKY